MKSLLSMMNISIYYLAVVLIHHALLYVILPSKYSACETYGHEKKKKKNVSTRNVSEKVLINFNDMNVDFVYKKHYDWGKKFALRSIVNILFNNEQKNVNDPVRKDQIKDFKKGQRKKE